MSTTTEKTETGRLRRFLRRHPWVFLAALTLAGMAASITMVVICSNNAPEAVPVEPVAKP